MKTLKLNDLKVQSFITGINKSESDTVKGGGRSDEFTVCCDKPKFR